MRSNMKSMNDRIVIAPDICNGKPVVKGTRITVQSVLEFLSAGDSIEDVLKEFPALTRKDVLACIRFSSRLTGHQFSVLEVA
jgi:uncharacterized protein (DUF433 family)